MGFVLQTSNGSVSLLSRNFNLLFIIAGRWHNKGSESSTSVLQKRQLSSWSFSISFKWYWLGQWPVTRPVSRSLFERSIILWVIDTFGLMNRFNCLVANLFFFQFASIVERSYILNSILREQADTPQKGSGPTNGWDEPILANISTYRYVQEPSTRWSHFDGPIFWVIEYIQKHV